VLKPAIKKYQAVQKRGMRRAALATGGGGPHDPAMDARVSVLEQIAKSTQAALVELRAEMRQGFSDTRTEMRELRGDARSDFRWLLGIMLGGFAALLGVMGKGFHWL
jgi:hypothetical protein